MKVLQNSRYKNKNMDIAFFLYFTVMALLYKQTYIQLAAQLGIIAYVIYIRMRSNTPLSKASTRNTMFLLGWFGSFTIFAKLSENWAYSVKENTNTVLTLFRILIIGIALFIYITDYTKAVSVIKAFIYSNVIMAIAALLTTPIYQYGKAGEEGFGNAIGQQRNTFGAVMAFLVLLCIVFYQYEWLKHGKILAIFFTLALLCSGSRGSMLQLVIIIVLYVITMPGLKRKVKYISAAFFIGLVVIVLLQNVPYLYETVWVRFEGLINTVLGIDAEADSSAHGRELYKFLAFEMYQEKPLLGFGVDGFFCYLRDVKFVDGFYLPPRYSHCNFTEIASCFGTIGLIIWYVPVFTIWFKSFKMRKKAAQMNLVFITLSSMIILDYARIPWSSHIGMYTYFCIILFFFWVKAEIEKKENMRRINRFGNLWEEDD